MSTAELQGAASTPWPRLDLPLLPPCPPMEAELVHELPAGAGWQFEPKWDGFRCLAFRDGAHIALQSKSGLPLTRYFPEVVASLQRIAARKFVLDGELVIREQGDISFDRLQLRLHPAASRTARLAAETPAQLITFDLLVNGRGQLLAPLPLSHRRHALELLSVYFPSGKSGIELSPATTNRRLLDGWTQVLKGHGIDGVVAKRLDEPYHFGDRHAVQKVKWLATADCVVGGFRYGKDQLVGSLLLGVFDGEGRLNHVGFCSHLVSEERRSLTATLEPLVEPPGFTGRAPGGPSRWIAGGERPWQPVKPKLVVEISYDYYDGARFRHGTRLLRFRQDKAPEQCTDEQLSAAG